MLLDQEWFLLGIKATSSITEGCPWRRMGVHAGRGVPQTGGWTSVAHWLWIATLGGVLWPDIDFTGDQWQAEFERGARSIFVLINHNIYVAMYTVKCSSVLHPCGAFSLVCY